jgi:hypothetical protein
MLRWRYVLDGVAGTDSDYGLELAPSLDNLSVDDVVVDDDGSEWTVADVHGKVVDFANADGHFHFSATIKELEDNDYTVKGAEPELTEVTLAEVAKMLGKPVETIRVKE